MTEFRFTSQELDVPSLSPGDVGDITMTCEVMSVDKDGVMLLKHGPVRVTKPFKEMDLQQLRDKVGVVEDEEMPMHESEAPEEDTTSKEK